MNRYCHSVILEEDLCIGCTNCIKGCPTEAIRVKGGKARIIDDRCIDCGVCILACPHHAKRSVSDSKEHLNDFLYKVAVPSTTLLSQFDGSIRPSKILSALQMMGFDAVFEESRGADYVTQYTLRLLKNPPRRPLISSNCPAIVRLIQIRFPSLIENILPIESPMEISAIIARQQAVEKTGLHPRDIGIYYISPCPAKVTSVRNPLGIVRSNVDRVLSIQSVYPCIQKNLKNLKIEIPYYDSGKAIGWARAGGECQALGIEHYLSVDGIENVIGILDEIENERITGIDFLECTACTNGCVGGCLTLENSFIARQKVRSLAEKNMRNNYALPTNDFAPFLFTEKIHPRNVHKLDDNLLEAMKKMEQIDAVHGILPNLDCGACGSPTCRSLAEDFILGYADIEDCIVNLKGKMQSPEKKTIK